MSTGRAFPSDSGPDRGDFSIITRVWFDADDPRPRARLVVVPGDRTFTAIGHDEILAAISRVLSERQAGVDSTRDANATPEDSSG